MNTDRFTAFISALDSLCRQHSISITTSKVSGAYEMVAFPINPGEDPDILLVDGVTQP